MLERIVSTLAAIRSQLLNNEVIRKLIVNDSNDAFNLSAPSIGDAEKYITLYPIYEFENKNRYDQNGMINVLFEDGSIIDDKNTIDGVIRINVVNNIDKWELVNNKIRPLELSNKIIELLDNKKFSISNPIKFDTIQSLIISKKLVGYALLFNIIDGSGNLDNY